jgi:hypothetical protein
MPCPSYSPDTGICGFWVFPIVKRILKDCEFNSNDEIEEAITLAWNDLNFDDVHRVFDNWMNRLAWVIKNGGE